ncbi:MAG: flavodoxin family protein [Bacteroidales bacterium]|nr:flavodoxin family protein [Bacteroidales bacterium]
MKQVITFNGSPRKNGNTSALLNKFIEGVETSGGNTQRYDVHDINLKYCTGCLRCNLLRRCSLRDDDWAEISEAILQSDVLVFASPVYFHHVTAPLKKLIDRFRSFVHVQITEEGLNHTPHQTWKKDFVLLLCMGSSSDEDAQPIVELFKFMTSILGPENKLHIITATRLGVTNQVIKTEEELRVLYEKINLPVALAEGDFKRNNEILDRCFELGESLSR